MTNSDNIYRCEGVGTKAVVLKFECASESPRGLIKAQISGPHLQDSDSVGLGGAPEFAFLASSQVMLMLLALGPHFENR